jgi:hypothetical protein
MHDGRVSGLAMAYDDSCVISAAADGTLLLMHNALGPAPSSTAAAAAPREPNAGLPTLAQAAAGTGAAHVGAGPLSLEEAKQAAQHDQQAATAAAERQHLVSAVEVLRQELAALMKEDAARPRAERLPAEAFHLDQGGWAYAKHGGTFCGTFCAQPMQSKGSPVLPSTCRL